MAKVPGSIWIEGENFHWVDQFNREWYFPGYLITTTIPGYVAGQILLNGQYPESPIHYINESGTAMRGITGPALAFIPRAQAKHGSIWINENNRVGWIAYHSGTEYSIMESHKDVPQGISHGDTHTDGTHSDGPHYDVAHVDQHGDTVHQDYHTDIPHSDFNDNAHGDFNDSDANHSDFTDHMDCYHPIIMHDDDHTYWQYLNHGDCVTQGPAHADYETVTQSRPAIQHDQYMTHNDSPHYDSPHQDWHSDSPHQDGPQMIYHEDHWDAVAHVDQPHTDIPHTDAAHADAHGDSHGDTPHGDEPIYVGP